ncbi:type II toxin-antitoxin system RatA family toxin [Streptomyces sp. S465]|uniref:type II toxin-antitoxin system RatA family toxin n=1 Tax=Streptomyces sp. S465 TaxID=2979468 RepID=UPI0022A8A0B4|nr:SRPBCC family protein [Streptomyces sp. S465]WAP60218.1 cyclase [Streptomyces sp. S465]
MKTVHVDQMVVGWDRFAIYEKLKDGESYKQHAPEHVKSVLMESTDDPHTMLSHWELYFRNGLLEWSERDHYDEENTTLRFEQIDGDFDEFHGSWEVSPVPDPAGEPTVRVRFTATFDFGVPSVEAMIEPVAAKLLEESVSRIITELFSGSGSAV